MDQQPSDSNTSNLIFRDSNQDPESSIPVRRAPSPRNPTRRILGFASAKIDQPTCEKKLGFLANRCRQLGFEASRVRERGDLEVQRKGKKMKGADKGFKRDLISAVYFI